MEKFVVWWKRDKRYLLLVKAVLMGILPILCCLVTCAAQGKTIGDVYLPNSEWNDELFYFKQVEGIVHYGYPQGYFGFNESHALKLSFAAWSPVLVFPWVVWGLLFGWNLLSPILCNILLLTAAMVLFVCLVKPSWRQLGVLTLLFCLYTHFVRYMLSAMPEIICMSLLILFYAIAVNYLNREKTYKLVLLFLLGSVLTLMRPYMLLFLLLPVYFWVRKAGWKGLLGSLGVIAVVGAGYAMTKRYLGAEYFTPLFFTDWITTFFDQGIGAGIHNFFGTLYWMGREFLNHTRQGFQYGLASGAFFGGYLVMMAVLLWQTMADYLWLRREKRREQERGKVQEDEAEHNKVKNLLMIEGHLALCFVGMLFALLLMYKLTEGSKHLLTFMAVGIFVISLMKTRLYKKAVLMGAVFAYLYSYMAVNPYDYQVPFENQDRAAQLSQWEEAIAEELSLVTRDTPNYENVVIWLLNDNTPEGARTLNWQLLYALPRGFGISCCDPGYVTENFDRLQSRYLAVVPEGTVDEMCLEAGYREIYRDKDMALYERASEFQSMQ
nr:hypothetical protein [uncultured Acetatifactor sp.]